MVDTDVRDGKGLKATRRASSCFCLMYDVLLCKFLNERKSFQRESHDALGVNFLAQPRSQATAGAGLCSAVNSSSSKPTRTQDLPSLSIGCTMQLSLPKLVRSTVGGVSARLPKQENYRVIACNAIGMFHKLTQCFVLSGICM